MSVNVSPDFLGFKRPFDKPVTTFLRIHNPQSKPVLVKIKTTSPKAYCVRPNSSRVESGETIEVAVILQAMKEDPPLGARCKDKFLVCSAIIPVEKEVVPLSDLWSELEKTNKNAITEHKLRCVYLSSSEPIPEDGPVGDFSRVEDGQAFASPSQNGTGVYTNGHLDGTPSKTGPNQFSTPVLGGPTSDATTQADLPSGSAVNGQSNSSVPTTQISVPSTKKDSAEDQLAEARREIERLKAQLSAQEPQATGLRKRINATGSGSEGLNKQSGGGAVQQVVHTGVPIPVVAVVSVVVFMVTYWFF